MSCPLLTKDDRLREQSKETLLLRLEHDLRIGEPLINGWMFDTWEHDWAAQFINGYESHMAGKKCFKSSTECFKRGYQAYKEGK